MRLIECPERPITQGLETQMIVDFQHHYTPPELMERGGAGILRLDQRGNPNYKFNPLLANLPAHVRMIDRAGIDVAVLSCGAGFDQPDLATCRLINDRLHQAERDFPGRFIGLAHVAALEPKSAVSELKRCLIELDGLRPPLTVSARSYEQKQLGPDKEMMAQAQTTRLDAQ